MVPNAITTADYFVGEGTTTVLRTTLSWTEPEDSRVTTYDISISSVNGYSAQMTSVAGPSVDIDHLPAGDTYTFNIRSRTLDNRTSAWVASTPALINGNQPTPSAPAGLTVQGAFNSTQLSWPDVPVFNLDHYEVQRAPVTGGVVGDFTTIATTGGNAYVDNDAANLQPSTTWAYQVRAVTTTGIQGAYSVQSQATTTLVGTSDISPNAVTSFAAIQTTPDLAGSGTGTLTDALDLSITVPAGGNRAAVLMVNGQQGTSGGSAYRYQIIVNGTIIFDRTVALYLDYPNFSFDIELNAGATNTVTVNWGGDTDVTLSTVDAIIFGRAA
jgi:hypothetical protein